MTGNLKVLSWFRDTVKWLVSLDWKQAHLAILYILIMILSGRVYTLSEQRDKDREMYSKKVIELTHYYTDRSEKALQEQLNELREKVRVADSLNDVSQQIIIDYYKNH